MVIWRRMLDQNNCGYFEPNITAATWTQILDQIDNLAYLELNIGD